MRAQEPPAPAPVIVLYDGVCNLCSNTVRFIYRRDPRGAFRFAALQSPAGQYLLARHGLPPDQLQTLVLIDGNAVFTRSDAFLEVVKRLRGAWPLLRALRFVPRRLRDWVYGIIARHRYRWFGRRGTCELPPAVLRERFL